MWCHSIPSTMLLAERRTTDHGRASTSENFSHCELTGDAGVLGKQSRKSNRNAYNFSFTLRCYIHCAYRWHCCSATQMTLNLFGRINTTPPDSSKTASFQIQVVFQSQVLLSFQLERNYLPTELGTNISSTMLIEDVKVSPTTPATLAPHLVPSRPGTEFLRLRKSYQG